MLPDMNHERLFQRFNSAIAWNSIFYGTQRISKIGVTCALFIRLSAQDFAAWANILSLVFLATVLGDFGLRRSLPRYCPEFARNATVKKKFINRLLIGYAILLLLVNLLSFMSAPYLAHLLRLSGHLKAFYLGCILFFTESIRSLLRLIFTSHFWGKHYNLIEAFCITSKTLVILSLALFAQTTDRLMYTILLIEIVSGLCSIAGSLILLPFLHNDPDYQQNEPINAAKLSKEFALHSLCMWFIIVITSFTERNTLVPFFSYTMSHATSNLFKVANDIAVFFHRFIVSVVATPSRTLLSHVEAQLLTQQAEDHSELQRDIFVKAFEKANKKIIFFSVPPIGIAFSFYAISFFDDTPQRLLNFFLPEINAVAQIFLPLVIFYLTHLLFITYEQVLEVKKNYQYFLLSFLPYLIIFVLFSITLGRKELLGGYTLIGVVAAINSIKLASILLRVYIAHTMYKVPIFTQLILRVFFTAGAASSALLMILKVLLKIFA